MIIPDEIEGAFLLVIFGGACAVIVAGWAFDKRKQIRAILSRGNQNTTKSQVAFWRTRILISLGVFAFSVFKYDDITEYWDDIFPLRIPLFGEDVPLAEFHIILTPVIVFATLPLIKNSLQRLYAWVTASDVNEPK